MRFIIVVSCRSTIHHHGEESLCILLSEMISFVCSSGICTLRHSVSEGNSEIVATDFAEHLRASSQDID
jgi:hypothetical protein